MNQEFYDVQTGLAALMYYHYRQAGCPMGDTISGFNAWIELSLRSPFEKFSDRAIPDNDPSPDP